MFAAIIIGIFIISVIYAHSREKNRGWLGRCSTIRRSWPHQYVYDGVLFPARQGGFL